MAAVDGRANPNAGSERITQVRKIVISALLLVSTVAPAYADLPVAKGENQRFDRARIPLQMRSIFDLFQSKCSGCHSLERVVISYRTGVLPLSGAPFDRQAMKGIIFSMMQKSARGKPANGQITREEAKDIMRVMSYLLDESVH